MAKGKFIRDMKAVKKDLVPTLINGALRGAGTVGAAFAHNTIVSKLAVKKPAIGKLSGPLMFGLGVLGEVFLNDEKAKAVCQGISAYGVLQTGGLILQKDKIGLTGTVPFQGVENQFQGEPEISGDPNTFEALSNLVGDELTGNEDLSGDDLSGDDINGIDLKNSFVS